MRRQKLVYSRNPIKFLRYLPKNIWFALSNYWHKSIFSKFVVIFSILILFIVGTMYGIARWYIASESSKPINMGVSFIPDYAQYLGLNPQTTMSSLINDLHVSQFRLTSYWSDIETSPGHFDFSQLDWEFKMAQAAHAKISLSIGLRQPRWPECHTPSWTANEPSSTWQPQLYNFMTAVINRYKNSPSLQSYQLENEYFNKVFGTCTDFSRDRLVYEYNLVKSLDSSHQVIVSRSNNAIGFPLGQPTPDEYGISVYKRVWDSHSRHYFEYPIPAWYYAFLGGVQKIFFHKDMVIHELQAEAWPPHAQSILQTSLDEQNKSMNAEILKNRFKYGESTGMKTIYVWGSEYWYYRLTILHDPSLWNVAKQNF